MIFFFLAHHQIFVSKPKKIWWHFEGQPITNIQPYLLITRLNHLGTWQTLKFRKCRVKAPDLIRRVTLRSVKMKWISFYTISISELILRGRGRWIIHFRGPKINDAVSLLKLVNYLFHKIGAKKFKIHNFY